MGSPPAFEADLKPRFPGSKKHREKLAADKGAKPKPPPAADEPQKDGE